MTINEFRAAKITRLIQQKYVSVNQMTFDHSKELVRSSFDLAIAIIEATEDGE